MRLRTDVAPLFTTGAGFFLAADKVQVKYEMLRAGRKVPGGRAAGGCVPWPVGHNGVARRVKVAADKYSSPRPMLWGRGFRLCRGISPGRTQCGSCLVSDSVT